MLDSSLIPYPVLEKVENLTGFPAFTFDKLGQAKQFYDVVILKGSFDIRGDTLVRSIQQIKPVLADAYWDEAAPQTSSLKAASDVLLYKPGTDVYITGTVRTFERKAEKEWGGMLRVAGHDNRALIQKTLRFTGPRRWKHWPLAGWTLSSPERATEVPLRYEYAYGGYWIDTREKNPALACKTYPQNPSGSGHFGASHDTAKDYPGSQIELHPQVITGGNRQYLPGGFGPIARFWEPRLQLAGTYDAAWQKQFQTGALPYYPDDLDLRFFQNAPADQVTAKHLIGDEWLEMGGLFDDARALRAQLPRLRIDAELTHANGAHRSDTMKLDTVHIDLNVRQVFLTWRLTLAQTAGVTHATLHSNLIEKPKS